MEALRVDDIASKKQNLKLYPMPSKAGRFHLSESTEWKIYSLLGAMMNEGKGDFINISRFSRGLYLLRTDTGVTKKILFQ